MVGFESLYRWYIFNGRGDFPSYLSTCDWCYMAYLS